MLISIARKAFRHLPPNVKQVVRDKYAELKMRQLQRELRAVGAENIERLDNNHLLHHLRGLALQQLPKGVPHFVSVGCSGTWYFKWIEQMCAPQQHTGVEFYMPRPDDLPPNVTWIANTAGNMPEIGDGVADVLFSGQNIEHLWPDDIASFFLESRRVLKENGLLVIDSPNRRVTELLQWSQPEHTIEFNVEEMVELLDLAGFDVEKKFGIWLCEDPDTGKVLPLEEMTAEGPYPLSRRVKAAAEHVSSSFIWWIEARRATRQPQVQKLRERVDEIYRIAWPERLNRVKTVIGREFQHQGETWFDSDAKGGALVYGPYAPLLAGSYTATFSLFFPEGVSAGCAAVCEVVAANGSIALARREIPADGRSAKERFDVSMDFSLPDTTFAVEFRVIALQGKRICVRKAVALAERA